MSRSASLSDGDLSICHTPAEERALEYIAVGLGLTDGGTGKVIAAVDGVPVEDNAAIVHLSDLSQLDELDLQATDVSDKSIVRLTKLSHLSKLMLQETLVTHEGAKQLRQVLPNARVEVSSQGSFTRRNHGVQCNSSLRFR